MRSRPFVSASDMYAGIRGKYLWAITEIEDTWEHLMCTNAC